MNPVLLGLIAAVAWGIHDVVAARASKGIGAVRTATLVTFVGFLLLSAWLAWKGGFPTGPAGSLWLPLAAGAGIALATIWLFAALASGPLSLALPVVMCYPVTSLLFGALMGRQPSAVQLLGAVIALGGMVVVTRSEPAGKPATISRDAFRRTVGFAALSHVAYAAATFAGQHSATLFDPLAATWLSRIGGSLTILPVLVLTTDNPFGVPMRWLPAVLAMGGLDALALAAVNLAALTSYPELAVVTASSAGVISILIVWAIFREHIAWRRWIGIMLTFVGIAMLAGLR